MLSIRKKFRTWGKNMAGISWGTCATISSAGVATISILSGIFSNAVKQILINLNDPPQFLWFLFVRGLGGVLVICAIIVIFKFTLYVFGLFFICIGGLNRIDIQEIGNGTLLAEIQVLNNETEEFYGKLKVTIQVNLD